MGERARTTSAGDARGAAHTVSEALTVARSIERASFRAWGLSVVASAQASTGDVQVALATARSIQRAIRRNSALRAVAGAQAKAGDIEGVLSTAASIEDVPTHAWALRDIAKAQRDAANVRSEPDGDSTKWAAPTSSNTPVSENVALEGPWTAYAEGRGHDHRSQYFGLAWGRSTEAEAAAAATDACIRKAGADLTDNCDYTETYKSKCMVVGEATYTESLTGNRLTVFYPKVADTESEAVSQLRNDSDCGNCPIVANSCAR